MTITPPEAANYPYETTVYPRAANNGAAITSQATLLGPVQSLLVGPWTDWGNCWYQLYSYGQDVFDPSSGVVTGVNPDVQFSISAPNYQTAYFTTSPGNSVYVYLTYVGGWPQTY